jgi:lactate dehydrogenase-like 2-hydroxyacid dehydrogenase
LKLIGRAGTGTDNIDTDAATRHGILVMKFDTKSFLKYLLFFFLVHLVEIHYQQPNIPVL